MKYYEFNYSNIGSKGIDVIGKILSFLFMPALCIDAVIALIATISDNFRREYFIKSLLMAFPVSLAIGIVLLIRYFATKKGVFLYDDNLMIVGEENNINKRKSFFIDALKLKHKIKYNDINSCYTQTLSQLNRHSCYSSMFGGGGSYGDTYVTIISCDKTYNFYVKNPNGFVAEVNNRVLESKQ